jgi:hypothetical protein
MTDDEFKNLALSLAGKAPKPEKAAPRSSSAYDDIIEEASKEYGVDPNLIRAQMGQESSFNPRAKSHKGAEGLMQLIPATAKRFGVTDVYDPRQNIHAGVKYMRWLLDRFDGDVSLALAGYNAGEGAVEKYGKKIPPYKETQDYVTKILGKYQGGGGSPQVKVDYFDRLARALGTPKADSGDEFVSLSKSLSGEAQVQDGPPGRFPIPVDPTKQPRMSIAELRVEKPLQLDTEDGGALVRSPNQEGVPEGASRFSYKKLVDGIDTVQNEFILREKNGKYYYVDQPKAGTSKGQARVRGGAPQRRVPVQQPTEDDGYSVTASLEGFTPIQGQRIEGVTTPEEVNALAVDNNTKPTTETELSRYGYPEKQIDPAKFKDRIVQVEIRKGDDVRAKLREATWQALTDAGFSNDDIELAMQKNPVRFEGEKAGASTADLQKVATQDGFITHRVAKSVMEDALRIRANRKEFDQKSRNVENKVLKGRMDALDAQLQEGIVTPEQFFARKKQLREAEEQWLEREKELEARFHAENPEMSDDDAYSTFLTTGGYVAPGEAKKLRTEALEAEKRDIYGRFGGFEEYYKQKERIDREYGGLGGTWARPMARQSEVIKNIAATIPEAVASIAKSIDLFGEIVPFSVQNIESMINKGRWFDAAADGYAYQLGDTITKRLQKAQNKDLQFYTSDMILTNIGPKALGQMLIQIPLGVVTGGAGVPVALGAMMGAPEQYEAAKKGGAGFWGRKLAAVIGGGAAVSDAIPFMKFLAPMKTGTQKVNFLSKMFGSYFAAATKEVGEKAALEATKGTMIRILLKMGEGVVLEGGQELFEKKVNDLAAKIIYDPKRKVLKLDKEDLLEFLGGALGGAAGGGLSANLEVSLAPAPSIDPQEESAVQAFTDLLTAPEGEATEKAEAELQKLRDAKTTDVSQQAAQVGAQPLAQDQENQVPVTGDKEVYVEQQIELARQEARAAGRDLTEAEVAEEREVAEEMYNTLNPPKAEETVEAEQSNPLINEQQAPVPESPETVAAQLEATLRPGTIEENPKAATLITKGETVPKLTAEQKKTVAAIKIPETGETLIINKQRAKEVIGSISAEKVRAYVKENGYGKLLGYVEDVGSDTSNATVLQAKKGDVPVSEAVVSPESVEAQAEVNEKAFGPDITQEVKSTDEVAAERQQATSGKPTLFASTPLSDGTLRGISPKLNEGQHVFALGERSDGNFDVTLADNASAKMMAKDYPTAVLAPLFENWSLLGDPNTEVIPAVVKKEGDKMVLVQKGEVRPLQAEAAEEKGDIAKIFEEVINGKDVTADLKNKLWEKAQAGDTTELGSPSNVLIVAKKIREAGGLQTREEFDRYLQDFFRDAAGKTGAEMTAAATELFRKYVKPTKQYDSFSEFVKSKGIEWTGSKFPGYEEMLAEFNAQKPQAESKVEAAAPVSTAPSLVPDKWFEDSVDLVEEFSGHTRSTPSTDKKRAKAFDALLKKFDSFIGDSSMRSVEDYEREFTGNERELLDGALVTEVWKEAAPFTVKYNAAHPMWNKETAAPQKSKKLVELEDDLKQAQSDLEYAENEVTNAEDEVQMTKPDKTVKRTKEEREQDQEYYEDAKEELKEKKEELRLAKAAVKRLEKKVELQKAKEGVSSESPKVESAPLPPSQGKPIDEVTAPEAAKAETVKINPKAQAELDAAPEGVAVKVAQPVSPFKAKTMGWKSSLPKGASTSDIHAFKHNGQVHYYQNFPPAEGQGGTGTFKEVEKRDGFWQEKPNGLPAEVLTTANRNGMIHRGNSDSRKKQTPIQPLPVAEAAQKESVLLKEEWEKVKVELINAGNTIREAEKELQHLRGERIRALNRQNQLTGHAKGDLPVADSVAEAIADALNDVETVTQRIEELNAAVDYARRHHAVLAKQENKAMLAYGAAKDREREASREQEEEAPKPGPKAKVKVIKKGDVGSKSLVEEAPGEELTGTEYLPNPEATAEGDLGSRAIVGLKHSSPHKFEQFELSEKTALTGEGAMAYGYGLYLTESDKVLSHYHEKFTRWHKDKNFDYYQQYGMELFARENTDEIDATISFLSNEAPTTEEELSELEPFSSGEQYDLSVYDPVAKKFRRVDESKVTEWQLGDGDSLPVTLQRTEYEYKDPNGKNVYATSYAAFVMHNGELIGADVPGEYSTVQEAINDVNGQMESVREMADAEIPTPPQTPVRYNVEADFNPEETLLWDKPLDEQSEQVKKAVEGLGYTIVPGDQMDERIREASREKHGDAYQGTESLYDRLIYLEYGGKVLAEKELDGKRETGESLYTHLRMDNGWSYSRPTMDQVAKIAASKALLGQGIKGIKYLDGMSRRKGKGNYNYVIFSDRDVRITGTFSREMADAVNKDLTKYRQVPVDTLLTEAKVEMDTSNREVWLNPQGSEVLRRIIGSKESFGGVVLNADEKALVTRLIYAQMKATDNAAGRRFLLKLAQAINESGNTALVIILPSALSEERFHRAAIENAVMQTVEGLLGAEQVAEIYDMMGDEAVQHLLDRGYSPNPAVLVNEAVAQIANGEMQMIPVKQAVKILEKWAEHFLSRNGIKDISQFKKINSFTEDIFQRAEEFYEKQRQEALDRQTELIRRAQDNFREQTERLRRSFDSSGELDSQEQRELQAEIEAVFGAVDAIGQMAKVPRRAGSRGTTAQEDYAAELIEGTDRKIDDNYEPINNIQEAAAEILKKADYTLILQPVRDAYDNALPLRPDEAVAAAMRLKQEKEILLEKKNNGQINEAQYLQDFDGLQEDVKKLEQVSGTLPGQSLAARKIIRNLFSNAVEQATNRYKLNNPQATEMPPELQVHFEELQRQLDAALSKVEKLEKEIEEAEKAKKEAEELNNRKSGTGEATAKGEKEKKESDYEKLYKQVKQEAPAIKKRLNDFFKSIGKIGSFAKTPKIPAEIRIDEVRDTRTVPIPTDVWNDMVKLAIFHLQDGIYNKDKGITGDFTYERFVQEFKFASDGVLTSADIAKIHAEAHDALAKVRKTPGVRIDYKIRREHRAQAARTKNNRPDIVVEIVEQSENADSALAPYFNNPKELYNQFFDYIVEGAVRIADKELSGIPDVAQFFADVAQNHGIEVSNKDRRHLASAAYILFREAQANYQQKLNASRGNTAAVLEARRQAQSEATSLRNRIKADINEMTKERIGTWRRGDRVFTSLAIATVATNITNEVTAQAAGNVLAFEKAADIALQRIFPNMKTGDNSPDSRESAMEQFKTGLAMINLMTLADKKSKFSALAGYNVDLESKLLGDLLIDLGFAPTTSSNKVTAELKKRMDSAMSKLEYVAELNLALNMWLERKNRTAVFVTVLDSKLKARGQSLQDIIDRGAFKEIPNKLYEPAIKAALDVTFGNPRPTIRRVLNAVSAVPIWTGNPLRFAKVLTNVMIFAMERSPVYAFPKLALKKPITGESVTTEDVSKATTAFVLTMVGMIFSIIGGNDRDDWYNWKIPFTDTHIDMRKYQPITQYFFIGDMLRRYLSGKLKKDYVQSMSLTDVASASIEGLTPIQRFDNPGFELLKSFAGVGDAPAGGKLEEQRTAVSKYWAERWAGTQLGIMANLMRSPLLLGGTDAVNAVAGVFGREPEKSDYNNYPLTADLRAKIPFSEILMPDKGKYSYEKGRTETETHPVLRLFGLNSRDLNWKEQQPETYAEQLAKEKAGEFTPPAQTPAMEEKQRAKREIINGFRNGKIDRDQYNERVEEAKRKGVLTDEDILEMDETIAKSKLEQRFDKLPNTPEKPYAEQVLEVATPEEKERLDAGMRFKEAQQKQKESTLPLRMQEREAKVSFEEKDYELAREQISELPESKRKALIKELNLPDDVERYASAPTAVKIEFLREETDPIRKTIYFSLIGKPRKENRLEFNKVRDEYWEFEKSQSADVRREMARTRAKIKRGVKGKQLQIPE